jgi:hypothetical protein
MSTDIHPKLDPTTKPEGDAQSLLLWLGSALLIVTGLITVAITMLGVAAGMALAYGGLIIATIAVFGFIMRFIGPEEH